MRIICVYICDYKDRNDYYLSLMPVGITSISAYLEQQGNEVVLANYSSLGYSQAVDETLKYKPDAVAVSIFSFNRTESLKYIRRLKKRDRDITIIAGGQHTTFLAESLKANYPEIDYLVKGEGEFSIKRILDSGFTMPEKIVSSPRIGDIDALPWPSSFSGKTTGVNPNEQFKYIITSRGCPSSCTYCSSPSFWDRKVTYRSAENILNELLHIRKRYGIIYFSIRDDNFTLNKKRVLEFCKLLENSGLYMMWNCQARVDSIDEEMLVAMKRSGLEHIQFGVESGSEKILNLYDKHITIDKIKRAASITRKTGIYLSFYLMAGMDGETESDIEKTLALIGQTKPHDVIISPVAYYPGTKIYRDSVKQGKTSDNIWFESSANGIYLKDFSKTSIHIRNMLKQSSKLTRKSIYTKNDFTTHNNTTGTGCWMNHIIEGDYYSNHSDIKNSIQAYRNMISEHPDNIWGYLRLADIVAEKNYDEGIKLLKTASKIVPNYYETWYMAAHIHYIHRKTAKAKLAIKTAQKLNPGNPLIIELSDIILKK